MSTNLETPRLNPLGNTILGGISSLLINAVAHPISTLQNCIMANPSSTLRTLRQSMGFTNLYRGYWAIGATDAVTFATAYVANDALRDHSSQLTASVVAGTACTLPICIGEGLARNRQVHGMPYLTIFQRALRPAGLVATGLREIPFTMSVFWLTPLLQEQLSTPSSITAQAVAGTTAGALCGLVTSPADLVKTRIQTGSDSESITKVTRAVFAENGWKGFFRGSGMRALYIGLAGAGMNIINNTAPHSLANYFQTK
jgi:hypothetical protein